MSLSAFTGHITLEEFIRGAQEDPWVLNMLRLDMNPAGWVLENRRKSAHFWCVNFAFAVMWNRRSHGGRNTADLFFYSHVCAIY